jgi:hypothetical protein
MARDDRVERLAPVVGDALREPQASGVRDGLCEQIRGGLPTGDRLLAALCQLIDNPLEDILRQHLVVRLRVAPILRHDGGWVVHATFRSCLRCRSRPKIG